MDKIECSVWNNGKNGWGLKVLGGPSVRTRHFGALSSPVRVELDGEWAQFNIDKKSFWTPACGELIGIALRDWIMKNRLTPGARVWLEIVRPGKAFKATTSS
jgi:hypothetical protein